MRHLCRPITALTVFPFSSQVMVGTGFPVALHCRETRLPLATFLSLGTCRIRAGTETDVGDGFTGAFVPQISTVKLARPRTLNLDGDGL